MAPRMGPDMGAQLRPMPGGSINVRVRKKDAVGRRELSVKDPGALPLQAGDELRIEVLLNRPAYPYVVWINATGKAVPVYPWQSGQWDKRPASEQPVERLSLPGKADGGLTVKAGPAGMETLVLLVRAEPLPRDIDLGQVLAGLPPQRLQNGHAVVWFENGGVVRGDPARAPKSFEPDQPGDPVLETQRAISESLKGFYPYTSAVSMAKRGGT